MNTVNKTTVAKTQATYDIIAATYAQTRHAERPLAAELNQFASLLPAGGSVLDIGCGPGFYSLRLAARNLSVIGLDLSRSMMEAGLAYHQFDRFVEADMCLLPFGNSAVAGIWANASLLHLPRETAVLALHEFWRVLQPGGILFLSLKEGNDASWSNNDYGHPTTRFFTFWQATELNETLKTADFTLISHAKEEMENVVWLKHFARKPA